MRQWKTMIGRDRTPAQDRIEFKELLFSLPPVFSCACNQCYCGCLKAVLWQGVYYCPACGRPKPTNYYPNHLPFCTHKPIE